MIIDTDKLAKLDLDAFTDAYVALQAESERRGKLARSQQVIEQAVADYAAAVAVEPARDLTSIPTTEAIGPGASVIIDGTEWVNQSRAFLSPHTAGPKQYPMGWRLKNAPTSAKQWAAGDAVKIGDQRSYHGTVYKVIQAHTCQTGWEPPNVPALWAVA